MENQLIPNNTFFMIPSWGKATGYPTLGKYMNIDVSSILSDPVIFFGGLEASVKTEKGILYFLFGLGYYYSKFELTNRDYVIDHRDLTCLMIPDFFYDSLVTAPYVTLANDPDVVINEKVMKTPIDLSHRINTQRSFIEGALTRNIFIPNKDIILEMFKNVQDSNSYNFDESGHQILCASPEEYNSIQLSEKMKGQMDSGYLKNIPGITTISFGADNLLSKYFTTDQLSQIASTIKNLKEVYSNITYDTMQLFSILEHANVIFGSKINIQIQTNQPNISTTMPKAPLFAVAVSFIDQFISWPDEIRRQTKAELEMAANKPKAKLYTPSILPTSENSNQFTSSSLNKASTPLDDKFEIRSQSNRFVESKKLPDAPKDSIENILLYIKYVIIEDFEMRAIGEAFNNASENIRKITMHTPFLFEMAKLANLYHRKDPNLALNQKEKDQILAKIDSWRVLPK